MSVEYRMKKLISNWGISIFAKREGKVRSLVLLCFIKKKKNDHTRRSFPEAHAPRDAA